jgi:hypothetical protein
MVRDVSGTLADYDSVWLRLEASGVTRSPEGLAVHVAASTPGGVRIVEVWESHGAFEAFGRVILPVVEELDLPRVCPQISLVHRMITSPGG